MGHSSLPGAGGPGSPASARSVSVHIDAPAGLSRALPPARPASFRRPAPCGSWPSALSRT
eukprot:2366485-Alexandrium_andersonii.AAC.1